MKKVSYIVINNGLEYSDNEDEVIGIPLKSPTKEQQREMLDLWKKKQGKFGGAEYYDKAKLKFKQTVLFDPEDYIGTTTEEIKRIEEKRTQEFIERQKAERQAKIAACKKQLEELEHADKILTI